MPHTRLPVRAVFAISQSRLHRPLDMKKVKLLREARIRHFAGETVEVTDEEAEFLVSVRSAVVVAAQPATKKKKAAEK